MYNATYNDSNVKQSKPTWKEKLGITVQNGKRWITQNKDIIIIATPFIIGSVASITKMVGKHINLRKEEVLKNLYCYDRSLGHYWRLRRTLSNAEWATIDMRKSRGERLSDILSEMKILK